MIAFVKRPQPISRYLPAIEKLPVKLSRKALYLSAVPDIGTAFVGLAARALGVKARAASPTYAKQHLYGLLF